VLGTVLISVAIGVGLAAVFVAGGFWLQVLISKGSTALAPALMIASLMIRLVVLAAVVIPLAVYTDLNLIALLAVFAVVFTALQTWIIMVQVKRGNAPDKGSKES
jgi:hypothetical protein